MLFAGGYKPTAPLCCLLSFDPHSQLGLQTSDPQSSHARRPMSFVWRAFASRKAHASVELGEPFQPSPSQATFQSSDLPFAASQQQQQQEVDGQQQQELPTSETARVGAGGPLLEARGSRGSIAAAGPAESGVLSDAAAAPGDRITLDSTPREATIGAVAWKTGSSESVIKPSLRPFQGSDLFPSHLSNVGDSSDTPRPPGQADSDAAVAEGSQREAPSETVDLRISWGPSSEKPPARNGDPGTFSEGCWRMGGPAESEEVKQGISVGDGPAKAFQAAPEVATSYEGGAALGDARLSAESRQRQQQQLLQQGFQQRQLQQQEQQQQLQAASQQESPHGDAPQPQQGEQDLQPEQQPQDVQKQQELHVQAPDETNSVIEPVSTGRGNNNPTSAPHRIRFLASDGLRSPSAGNSPRIHRRSRTSKCSDDGSEAGRTVYFPYGQSIALSWAQSQTR